MNAFFLVFIAFATVSAQESIYFGSLTIETTDDAADMVYQTVGQRLAVKVINDDPDILPGRTIEYLSANTAADDGGSFLAALELSGVSLDTNETFEKVEVIIGAEWSSLSMAAQPAAVAFDVPMLSPSATSFLLTDAGKYSTFSRVCPHDGFQSRVLLNICQEYGWQRVGVIATVDGYSASLAEQFGLFSADYGVQVLFTSSFDIATNLDIASNIAGMKASGLNVFLISMHAADASRVFDELEKENMLGYPYVYLGPDAFSNAQQMSHRLQGFIGVSAYLDQESDRFNAYMDNWEMYKQEIYDELYGDFTPEAPDSWGAYSYDAVHVAAKAVERVYALKDHCDAGDDTYPDEFVDFFPFVSDGEYCASYDSMPHGLFTQQVIRVTPHEGVSGTITMDEHGELTAAYYSILNWVDGEILTVATATIDTLEFSRDMVFVDGSTTPPPDRIVEPMKYVDMEQEVANIWIVLSICICLSVLVLAIFTVKMRSHRVFMSSSVTFLLTFSIGMLLIVLSVIFVTIQDEFSCGARIWLFHLGLTMAIGSLLLKTYRMHKIFNSKLLTQKRLTDSTLLKMLSLFLLGDAILLSCWTFIVGFSLEEDHSCSLSTEFSYLMLTLKAILVALSGYLSYQIKGIPSSYNDSTAQANVIYVTASIGALWLLISLVVGSTSQAAQHVTAGTLLAGSVFSMIFMFFPKIQSIREHQKIALAGKSMDYAETKTISGEHGDDMCTVDDLQTAVLNYVQKNINSNMRKTEELVEARQKLYKSLFEVREEVAYLRKNNMQQSRYPKATFADALRFTKSRVTAVSTVTTA